MRLDIVNANLNWPPPVTIINAQLDARGKDNAMLAADLNNAGVKVDHKMYSGVTHEFVGMGVIVNKAREAHRFGGQALAASFKR